MTIQGTATNSVCRSTRKRTFPVRESKDQTSAYLPPLSRHLAVVQIPDEFVVFPKDFHSPLQRTSLPELPPVVLMRCCRISVKEK